MKIMRNKLSSKLMIQYMYFLENPKIPNDVNEDDLGSTVLLTSFYIKVNFTRTSKSVFFILWMFKEMQILILIISSILLLDECQGNFQMQSRIIHSLELPGECAGSVILYKWFEVIVVTEDVNVRMNVDRVKVVGCGCFTLHDRKDGRGRSYFLGGEGEYILNMRVKSVRRVECRIYAWILYSCNLLV